VLHLLCNVGVYKLRCPDGTQGSKESLPYFRELAKERQNDCLSDFTSFPAEFLNTKINYFFRDKNCKKIIQNEKQARLSPLQI
jgi:hypothetical protein